MDLFGFGSRLLVAATIGFAGGTPDAPEVGLDNRHAGVVVYGGTYLGRTSAISPKPDQAVYLSGGEHQRPGTRRYAVCRLTVHDPHWSNRCRTAVFKSDVHCVGNMTRIRVRVRTFLARVKKRGGLTLVAGMLEPRTVAVNDPEPSRFYCPPRGVRVATHGVYRWAATLEIIEPNGITTEPITKQTHLSPVPRDFTR